MCMWGNGTGRRLILWRDLVMMCYIQVTKTITSEETYAREYGNLKLIKDNYPKYVVTMDPTADIVNDNGIITCTLRDFLKKRVLA